MDKSQYFYRAVVFATQEDKVLLVDINNPGEKPPALEPWLGLIVSLADGRHTIQQLIDHLGGRYDGPPPDNFEETLNSVIKRLTEAKVIKLADESVILPYYLLVPAEKMDLDMAKRLMAEDGYVQE
ncbi:MAG: hypothetical protein QF879_02845 [Candidatus Latescibacteria bacterium]|nr:hypothetical protein [Candidatus Latescibacterota bacterium]